MSKYDRLIDQLYSREIDRAVARAWVRDHQDRPGMDSYIETLLRDGARENAKVLAGEKTVEQAQAYARSLMTDGLGMPAHLVEPLVSWTPPLDDMPPETPAEPASEQPAAAPPPVQVMAPAAAPPSAAAPARPAASDRDAARQQVEKFEQAMRAAPGTPEWASYWKNPQAQAEYRAALEMTHGLAEPQPSPPPTLAGGAAASALAPPGPATPVQRAATPDRYTESIR